MTSSLHYRQDLISGAIRDALKYSEEEFTWWNSPVALIRISDFFVYAFLLNIN